MNRSLAIAALLLAVLAGPSPVVANTIDFSTLPSGSYMSTDAFLGQGVLFDAPYFVGFVQGDNALIGTGSSSPLSATFLDPITALSVTVAQSFNVSAVYSLTVFDSLMRPLATKTLTTSATGYSTMELSGFAPAAVSFRLENDANLNPLPYDEFALSSLNFTEIPEPSTFILGLIGVLALVGSRLSKRLGQH